MNRNVCSIAGALALLLVTSFASAQGAWSYPPPPPTYSSRPVAQNPAPPPTKRSLERGLIGAFNLGVPVMLNVDPEVVRPGADLNGFGGIDLQYVVFGLGAGVMWTPINFNDISNGPPGSYEGRSPMTRLYFSPEVRVQMPNKSPIVPYLGVTFDANWWYVHSYSQTTEVCGFFYCRTYAVFLFTPSMTAKLGFAFEVSEGTHIDVGIKYSLSGPGRFFPGRQQWVTPYVGMLFR